MIYPHNMNYEYVDYDREIKNVLTETVTNELFRTADNLYNFMSLVVESYRSNLEKYIIEKNLPQFSIIFIYKGGNVLRIIEREFYLELPNYASELLSSYYKKSFKRSDADFAIYVNPNLPNFDQIILDISDISFNTQVMIRNYILSSPDKYFEYVKYMLQYRMETLDISLRKIFNLNIFFDQTNEKYFETKPLQLLFMDDRSSLEYDEKYEGLGDKVIKFTDSTEKYIESKVISAPSSLYVIDNRALKFYQTRTRLVRFNLIRTKVVFNLLLDTNKKTVLVPLSGELLDVAIPLDDNLTMFFNNLNKSVTDYFLSSNDRILHFQSYTLSFLIHDLEQMLILNDLIPWKQSKWDKRLNRLFYMYYVQMYVSCKEISNSRKKYYLNLIYEFILPIIRDYTTTKNMLFLNSIASYINKAITNGKSFRMNNLLNKLFNLAQNLNFKQINNDFIDFIDLCSENLGVLLHVTDKMVEYDTVLNNNIFERELYKFNINQSLI